MRRQHDPLLRRRCAVNGWTFERFKEVLLDAETCARLTPWEEEFCDSMRAKSLMERDNLTLTDKQAEVMVRIEAKVYQT